MVIGTSNPCAVARPDILSVSTACHLSSPPLALKTFARMSSTVSDPPPDCDPAKTATPIIRLPTTVAMSLRMMLLLLESYPAAELNARRSAEAVGDRKGEMKHRGRDPNRPADPRFAGLIAEPRAEIVRGA